MVVTELQNITNERIEIDKQIDEAQSKLLDQNWEFFNDKDEREKLISFINIKEKEKQELIKTLLNIVKKYQNPQ